MEQSPYFNGENSDFEDDVVEVDFEDQFDDEKKKVVNPNEIGTFGIDPEEYPNGLTAKDVVPEEEEYSDEEEGEEEYSDDEEESDC